MGKVAKDDVGSAEGGVHSVDADVDAPMSAQEKRLLAWLGIAALAILLIVIGVSSRSGGQGATSSQSAEQSVAPAPTELLAAFGVDGGVAEKPAAVEPSSLVTSDAFDREEVEGGSLDWSILGGGGWSISDQSLMVDNEPEELAIASVPVPDSLGEDWLFAATVEQRASGIGLVWAVEDERNYWELRVNLNHAALSVNRVRNGERERASLIGPAGLDDGQTLGVQKVGDTITLSSDGEPFVSLVDPSFTGPNHVGVIAAGGSEASFSAVELSELNAAN